MYEKKILGFNKKIHTKLAFPPQQKTDTTAQLYCTLSTYITPIPISRENQKKNTTPQLYGTPITLLVCKTKTYFPQEQKTDTTAQLEKSSSSPHVASVFVSL